MSQSYEKETKGLLSWRKKDEFLCLGLSLLIIFFYLCDKMETIYYGKKRIEAGEIEHQ